MLKGLDGFVEIGTVGCFQGCGGIWTAYLPIFVDGEKLNLCYDSDAYYNDDNTPEFVVYDGNTMDEVMGEYGDDGLFVNIDKTSPLYNLYKKLRRGMTRAISQNMGFDSREIAKGMKAMEEYFEEHPQLMEKDIAQTLCDMIAEDMEKNRYFKEIECVGTDRNHSVMIVFENGQQFELIISELY